MEKIKYAYLAGGLAIIIFIVAFVLFGGSEKTVVEKELTAKDYAFANLEQPELENGDLEAETVEPEVRGETDEVLEVETQPAVNEEAKMKEEVEVVEKKSQSFTNDGTGKEDKKENSGSDVSIKDNLVDWGYTKSSGRKIDTVVIHSSYNALGGDEYDVSKLIDEYEEYEVSPHYLIDRKGRIYRLVKDENIAWHAGASEVPDGREGANSFSIGIELINNKEDEYTKSQYSSLNNLLDYLGEKYKIKYILGHDEISPGRKTDPWNINWKKVDR